MVTRETKRGRRRDTKVGYCCSLLWLLSHNPQILKPWHNHKERSLTSANYVKTGPTTSRGSRHTILEGSNEYHTTHRAKDRTEDTSCRNRHKSMAKGCINLFLLLFSKTPFWTKSRLIRTNDGLGIPRFAVGDSSYRLFGPSSQRAHHLEHV